MKFIVFGQKLEIIRQQEKWVALLIGRDGKKRPARDIFIPSEIREADLTIWLEDQLHERATPDNPDVVRIS